MWQPLGRKIHKFCPNVGPMFSSDPPADPPEAWLTRPVSVAPPPPAQHSHGKQWSSWKPSWAFIKPPHPGVTEIEWGRAQPAVSCHQDRWPAQQKRQPT